MSNSITTLVGLLHDFIFSSVSTNETSTSISAVLDFLKRAEAHLANNIATSPVSSPTAITQPGGVSPGPLSPVSSSGNANTSPISTLVDYNENVLGDPLLTDLKSELQNVTYVALSSRTHSPQIALYGDCKYVFNAASKQMTPSPIKQDSTLCKVLSIVSSKMGVSYNSILVTKYRDRNVGLGWHKDNEAEIDQSVPISTLSIGATRRFLISDSKDKTSRTQLYEKALAENSVLTMQSSLQNTHYHRLAEGRGSISSKRGVRLSLTFRRLKSSTDISQNTEVPSQTIYSC